MESNISLGRSIFEDQFYSRQNAGGNIYLGHQSLIGGSVTATGSHGHITIEGGQKEPVLKDEDIYYSLI